jgi:hypothetical protein
MDRSDEAAHTVARGAVYSGVLDELVPSAWHHVEQ